MRRRISPLLVIVLGACLPAGTGCGGQGRGVGARVAAGSGSAAGSSSAATTLPSAPSDALSAATGDIPDSQVFLTFSDRAAGYSIRYPEGWTRRQTAVGVSFEDRANVISVSVRPGSPPTPAGAATGLARLKRGDPTIAVGAPERLNVNGSAVLKLTYTRLSTADPVTGKRLPLTIDRYEYAHAGKTAIVDLGTPKGVDNVDAYRMISRSFRWR